MVIAKKGLAKPFTYRFESRALNFQVLPKRYNQVQYDFKFMYDMDTFKTIAYGFGRGLADSLLGSIAIFTSDFTHTRGKSSAKRRGLAQQSKRGKDLKENETETSYGMLKTLGIIFAFNGASFMIINFFKEIAIYALTFSTDEEDKDTEYDSKLYVVLLNMIFDGFWNFPMYAVSRVLNLFWFKETADYAYKKYVGRPKASNSISSLITEVLFTLLLTFFFILQETLVNTFKIPYFGWPVSIIHMSLLYSYYAFEYKWSNMGVSLHKRLSFVENNWPYFTGYGLIMAIASSLSSSAIVNGLVFSVLLPIFIVSGHEAKPFVAKPSLFPLRLFAPSVYLCNAIFSKLGSYFTYNL
ncbi:Etoposide-induced protein 2.4 [Nymphon striatum]|nr:Etoposide-induced protein 2.4 [Nymphon striatum]